MRKKMPPNLFLAALIVAILGSAGVAWAAQAAPAKQPGIAKVILDNWNEIGNKLIAMAEDFPEGKYDYRPNAQVRTFAEQLLHAAGTNYYAINAANGKRGAPVDENPSRASYKTKAQVVAFVKRSVEEGAAAIERVGDEGVLRDLGTWAGVIEHMGEHYGQLVVYYRNNGLVPPASRGPSR